MEPDRAGPTFASLVVILAQQYRPTAVAQKNLSIAQDWALERCRQIGLVLAQTTPEAEAAAFARWLIAISEHVAFVPDLAGPAGWGQPPEALPLVCRTLDTLTAVRACSNRVGADLGT